MLTIDTVATELMIRGLISPRSVLFGDLSILNQARRNRNIRIQQRDGPGYLIKQPDAFHPGSRFTFENEAHFYEFFYKCEKFFPVRSFLPRLVALDFDSEFLCLELLESALTLWPVYGSVENVEEALCVSKALGAALASIHASLGDSTFAACYPYKLSRQKPWILGLHRPGLGMLTTISQANYELIEIIQGNLGLEGWQLDELASMWQASTVIHGDIKGENVLWTKPESMSRLGTIKIVDWEMVQIGDPAWDVAGFLHDLLIFWIGALPGAESIDEMAANCKVKLVKLHCIARSFWQAYALSRGDVKESQAILRRSVRFVGARLIQSAYEAGATASALPLQALLYVQLSANLLRDPDSGQVQLMGIFDEI